MPSLDALIGAGLEVVAVVTNPDRPQGRGLRPQPSPVKRRALEAGLGVHQPERVSAPEVGSWLSTQAPTLGVVVAFGSILPKELIETPPLGFVNLHFSLLPAYRGAAPVQRALLDGVPVTGVSTMVMTEGLDEGPVLAQRRIAIDPEDTAGSLGERLAEVGAGALVESLSGYAAGELTPRPQDHSAATYAPKVSEAEARIDWRAPSADISRRVRALNPAPGAWTTLRGRRIKVHRVTAAARGLPALPAGRVTVARDLVIGTGDTPLVLTEVQSAGRRRMSGADLARGLRLGASESAD